MKTVKQTWPVPHNSRMAIKRHEYHRARLEGLPLRQCAERCTWAADMAAHFGLDLAGWLQYTDQL